MSYRLAAGEAVEAGVRRIAMEQIERGLAELDDPQLTTAEQVHQVRKRCKKLRGLLRLVRPGFKLYRQENAWYRDAADLLADLRDVASRLAIFDKLQQHIPEPVDPRLFAPLRERLAEPPSTGRLDEDSTQAKLAEFRQRFREGRERIDSWHLEDTGCDAFLPGLVETYDRGRESLKQARRKPKLETLHEWRKQVKYHWYHIRLVQPLWKPVLGACRSELRRLSDNLGEEHDLGLFREYLMQMDDPPVDLDTLDTLLEVIDQRCSTLRKHAWKTGLRVYAEKPRCLARRLQRYWKVWR